MPNPSGPIPLGYGYVFGTGNRVQYYMLQNTGDDNLDYTRVGCWVLGQDEWDGLIELWDKSLDRLFWTNENGPLLQQSIVFGVATAFPLNSGSIHYHRGCDAVIGSGLNPTSTGPDQGVDAFWQYLPPGLQPLTYNRQANYWLMMKNFINDPPNDKQDVSSNFADIDPIGLWRALRVRIFDATGAMTAYAFTTNPAWQMLDVLLRMRLYPEYKLDLNNGPDDLTSAVRSMIDFAAFADAAAWYDAINDQGRKNYEGSWLFSNPTSLQGLLTPMMQSCRSYMLETGGVYGLRYDASRASVFTVSRRNMLSFSAEDTPLHTAPNKIVTQFRDLLVPAIHGTIASISFPSYNSSPTVTMTDPHPLMQGDSIVIGGTNTTYDTEWTVASVPAADASGNVYSFSLVSRGSNYPSSVGAGGYVGLTYARFKQRSPEFNHHRNQLARGAAGVGLPRQRNKLAQTLDLGNSTYDQVYRVGMYERDRALGPDAAPYQPVVSATVELDPYAADAAGSANRPIGLDPGDIITIDDTASVPYAGLYEIVDPLIAAPDTVDSSGAVTVGKITAKLLSFDPNRFYDQSDLSQSGWIDVPGSDPGSATSGTDIDLNDGGVASFFTGLAASSDTLVVPDSFNPSTLLAWIGAAGAVAVNDHLHVLRNCDYDPTTLLLSCVYSDGNAPDADIWTGDNSYAGLVSRALSSVNTYTIGPMTYRELTLAGGEKVIFGSGLVSGTGALNITPDEWGPNPQPPYTVQLPAGYSLAQAFCLATIKDGIETGDNDAHGFAAWVDPSGMVHSLYQDGEGHQWIANNCRLFVFAWQNNMGSVATDASRWIKIPLSTGKTLAVAGFELYDPALNGSIASVTTRPGVSMPLLAVPTGVLPLPSGMTADSLQAFTGPVSFQIIDHQTHGIRDCYLDGNLNSQCSFEDGSGNIWYGTAAGFFLLCDVDSSADTLSLPRLNPTNLRSSTQTAS
jgi:hypothetical protein